MWVDRRISYQDYLTNCRLAGIGPIGEDNFRSVVDRGPTGRQARSALEKMAGNSHGTAALDVRTIWYYTRLNSLYPTGSPEWCLIQARHMPRPDGMTIITPAPIASELPAQVPHYTPDGAEALNNQESESSN